MRVQAPHCSALEVAEEEEVDCKLDVCVDVEPVEEDVEGCVHANCFELSEIHLGVVSFCNPPCICEVREAFIYVLAEFVC